MGMCTYTYRWRKRYDGTLSSLEDRPHWKKRTIAYI